MSSSDYIPVPGHPLLRVQAEGDEIVHARYIGPAAALLAARAATAEMLAPGARGKRRFDEAGERFRIHRYPVPDGGEAIRRYQVSRVLPRERALRLPGIQEALTDAARTCAEPEGPLERCEQDPRIASESELADVIESYLSGAREVIRRWSVPDGRSGSSVRDDGLAGIERAIAGCSECVRDYRTRARTVEIHRQHIRLIIDNTRGVP